MSDEIKPSISENDLDPEQQAPLLERMVELSLVKFLATENFQDKGKIYSYGVHHAASDVISELGTSPRELFETLVSQTKLNPEDLNEMNMEVDYSGDWELFCRVVCMDILTAEVYQRFPETNGLDRQRLDKYGL